MSNRVHGVDIKKYQTEHAFAAAIAMGVNGHRDTYVVVEGPTDEALFSELLNERVRFHVAEGKTRVVAIMKLLEGYKVERALGIVDADYWPLTGDKPDLPNLFITDTPDVESLVVRSEAFRKTVKNYCNAKFIEELLREEGLEDPVAVRDVLVKGAAKLGYLRYMSQKEKKSIDFKAIDFASFVDIETLKVDEEALRDVLESSGRAPRSLVAGWLDRYAEEASDPWKFACGHDIVSLMVVALRQSDLGWRENRETYNKDDIEAGLRQAYETRHFRETCLCRSIEDWAERSLGRSLLRN
jgi:hypothetical protein